MVGAVECEGAGREEGPQSARDGREAHRSEHQLRDGVAPQRRGASQQSPAGGIEIGVEEQRSWGGRLRKVLEKGEKEGCEGVDSKSKLD